MNDKPTPSPAAETQTTRRLKYGFNVAVAVVVALALVVLVNWIAYRHYVRLDLTATRQYSLSRQTERVLDRLDEPFRIVSLFRVSGELRGQVRDLIDEYGRYSPQVQVQHIDPDLGVSRREAFYQQLRERFDDRLAPTVEAIDAGRQALRRIAAAMASLAEPLDEVIDDPQLPDGQLKQFVSSVRAALTSSKSQVQQRQEGLDIALDQAMPDYGGIRSEVQRLLQELDTGLLSVAVQRFERIADDSTAPAHARDRLLGISADLARLRDQARSALEALRNVAPVDAYNQLVVELGNAESVVVVSPDQVRVIPLADMYRQADQRLVQQAGAPEMQFLGEERLTGALVSMSVERPAMVVFVQSGGTPAIGPRGAYTQVAQRLEAANFRVEQWNPGGQTTAMGQQLPPQPPPQAESGQQTIWVVLPFPPGGNPMAMMQHSGQKTQIAELLEAELKEGDAAIVMFAVNVGAQFGAEDPIVDFVTGQWGIHPQLDRIVMQQVQLPNRQTRASTQFLVDQWPDALPITKALVGMQAVFLQGCPLTAAGAEGVELWPLVSLRGDRVWAESDLQTLQTNPREAAYDPAAAADSFTVAMAAQRDDGGRLVVVADPAWASDQITRVGVMGPGTAELFGAAFPGNSELFVNSVYWLAGLDELIAASPRTQDIRRIEPMGDAALYSYRAILLAGVPAVIIVIGLSVWFVRRRS